MEKIIEIKEADVKDGGSGAFYIYLKKKKLISKNVYLVSFISKKWKHSC